MNSNNYDNGEYEINLIQAAWELLMRWKLILLTGLLFAILVPGVKYISDLKANKEETIVIPTQSVSSDQAQDDEESQTVSDDCATIIDTYKGKLSISQADDVDNLYTAIKTLHSQREYTNKSELMKLDPYHVKSVNLTFVIENSNNNNNDNGVAASLYEHYVLSASFRKALSEDLELDSDIFGLDNLISVTTVSDTSPINIVTYDEVSDENLANIQNYGYELSNAYMYVSFILPETVEEDDAVSAINKIVTSYELPDSSIKDLYKIKLVEHDVFERLDNNVLNIQNSNKSRITSEVDRIEKTVNAFSDNQKKLLDMYLKIEGLDKKGYISESFEENTESSQVVNNIPTIETNTIKVEFSKKYMIIGFLLGVFIYVAGMFAYWILSSKAGRITESAYLCSLPLLGVLTDNDSKNNYFTSSKIIKKLRDRKLEDLEARFDNTVSAMEFYQGVNGQDNISLVTMGTEREDVKTVVENISAKYKNNFNKEIKIHNLPTDGKGKTNLYKGLDALSGGVILVISYNNDRIRDVEKICHLITEKGTKIIGQIGVE